ncbi:efflux transporter outer membrane subunit, partial [Phenylobacterium sp.]|uniref:efflux transporter outer membrane subunit n=1 Tax=Phenylobacterium sp. TaxID=1871053 RepID=UPI0025DB19CC
VERALAANTDIAIAAGRVAEARAQFRLAEAQRLPGFAVAAGGGRQRDVSPFGQPREQTAGQAVAQVSYDTDLFGRLAASSGAAREALLATEAARDNVRLAVAASAAGGYITLRGLDARLVVLRETVAAREAALKLIRRRAEAGYGTQLDLRQAEADYRATAQQIPVVELAIRRQEDGLSLLLGDDPRAIARGAALEALVHPTVPPGLPSALLRRRPDVAQAEHALAGADRSLDAARAAFLPNVQLTANGGYVASSLLSDEIGVFSLGGSVLAPIFDTGRLRAQQDAAVARRDQAAFAYRKTALNAFREVEDALAAVQRVAEQEREVTVQRAALAEAYRLAESRYRAGYSPYLDQLEAQRGLLATDLLLVQVRADRLNAAVSLYQALGGGWSAPTPGRPPR